MSFAPVFVRDGSQHLVEVDGPAHTGARDVGDGHTCIVIIRLRKHTALLLALEKSLLLVREGT